jgi:hypothetical protein
LIVQKASKAQRSGLLDIRDQDYWQVMLSTTDQAQYGDILITKPRQAYEITYNGNELYYIPSNSIMLIINDTIKPGKNYHLAKSTQQKHKLLDIDDISDTVVDIDGVHTHISKYAFTVDINATTHYIVHKDDLICQISQIKN